MPRPLRQLGWGEGDRGLDGRSQWTATTALSAAIDASAAKGGRL